MPVFTQETRPKSKKRRLEYPDPPGVSNLSPQGTNDIKIEDIPGPSHSSHHSNTLTDNTKSVSASCIDQVQKQLVQSLMHSPPDQILKTFCDITSGAPELPFKICDRCPHCVAFSQEINRLFKSAENAERSALVCSIDLQQNEFFELNAITSRGTGMF